MSAQISNQYQTPDSAKRVDAVFNALTSTESQRSRSRADELVTVTEELLLAAVRPDYGTALAAWAVVLTGSGDSAALRTAAIAARDKAITELSPPPPS